LGENQLPVLLEYSKASLERIEQRLRYLEGLARVAHILDEYALAHEVGLQLDDVPVGLGEILRRSWRAGSSGPCR
jgi:hypothetical protein